MIFWSVQFYIFYVFEEVLEFSRVFEIYQHNYNAVQYNTMQCNAMQHNTIQYINTLFKHVA